MSRGSPITLLRDAEEIQTPEEKRLVAEAARARRAERRFLPTLSDLVDRLTISQMKAIFISEKKDAYVKEMSDIMHDIDLIIADLAASGKCLGSREIHAICVIMLSNRFIWESESKARAGGNEQDKLLKLTHSINGVRNAAKNELAAIDGGRLDYKLDCLAADLPPEFGNWAVFGEGEVNGS